MSISFGGLATGLDTGSIINALLQIEQVPIDRLEAEKKSLNTRLDAFKDFDEKLKGLLSSIEALDTPSEVNSYKATAGSDEYFTASASSAASAGTYQIEVESLAQIQKDVSTTGYATTTEAVVDHNSLFDFEINGTTVDFSDGDSLADMVQKVNDANIDGVTASTINTGTDGYKMVLTGVDASTPFTTVNASQFSFTTAQAQSEASINVDGINITSANNSFSDVITGVTIDLNKAETGVVTNLKIDADKEAITAKIDTFVTAYNDVLTFINGQTEKEWGHESAFRSVQRNLQNMLVHERADATSNLHYLTELGISSNSKTGLISLNSSTLQEKLDSDLDSVIKLLAGDSAGTEGVFEISQLETFLDGATDYSSGILASRTTSTDSSLRNIDLNIVRMEARLEQKEEFLNAQFAALEQLMSSMNSQGNYLTQQISLLSNSKGS